MGRFIIEDENIIERGNMTNKTKTFEQQFLQDIIDERSFIKVLGKKPITGMESEVIAMVRVYNEQLDGFVKNRFDVEIFRRLSELNPEGGKIPETPVSNKEKYKNAQTSLEQRHIILGVVREQILMKLIQAEK